MFAEARNQAERLAAPTVGHRRLIFRLQRKQLVGTDGEQQLATGHAVAFLLVRNEKQGAGDRWREVAPRRRIDTRYLADSANFATQIPTTNPRDAHRQIVASPPHDLEPSAEIGRTEG